MGSRLMPRRLLRAAGVLCAITALPALGCSEVEESMAWPQGRGVPRNVRPIVFNVFGRVERLLLLDVGPASQPVNSTWLDKATHPAGVKPKPDLYGRPVAIDVRVLMKPHGLAIVEIVPWAGRPLPARRRFQVVDPDVPPGQGSARSAVLGEFETGDAYDEGRGALETMEPKNGGHYRPRPGIGCDCGEGLFAFRLAPVSAGRRPFAVWLYADSPGAPPLAYVLSQIDRASSPSESLTIERTGGILRGQGIVLIPGERWLVVRERMMNGSYGPAFRFRVSIPRMPPQNGACDGA